jgi:predicted PurR-regulated permease PerM
LLAAPLTRAFDELVKAVTSAVDGFVRSLQNYAPGQSNLNFILEPLSRVVPEGEVMSAEEALQAIADKLTLVGGVLGFLGSALLIHILALFLLIEAPVFGRGIRGAVPEAFQRESGILATRMHRIWSNYLWTTLLLALIIGVSSTLQLFILGVPNAVVVGIITAFFALIPMIGGVFVIATNVLVTLIQGSTYLNLPPLVLAGIALIMGIIVEMIIWNVIYPKLTGHAVELPISVILVGVVVGGAAAGMLGTFLVSPVLGWIRELLIYLIAKVRAQEPYPEESAPDTAEPAQAA